jgi:cell division protein FtsQ
MKKVLAIFKWNLAIILLVVLLVFSNFRQTTQTISLDEIKIKESSDNFINKQIVLNFLKDKLVRFDSVLINDFNKEKLEDILELHPAIKEVEVFASQKGGVNILIEQKKAIVRVKSKTEDYYLDEFGSKMQLSDHYTPKLVVATGDIFTKHHAGIYEFINEINNSEFWSSQITQIHFEYNDILLITRVGSQKINIGSFKNISEKLDNLYQFYKIVMPLKGWQNYSSINLNFNNQIVCVRK